MFLFADTSFLVSLKYTKDKHHVIACEIWKQLCQNRIIKGYEDIYVSDYIIVETFKRLQKYIGLQGTLAYHDELCSSCNVVKISYPDTIQEAIDKHMKFLCNHVTKKPKIGLVDATSLVVMFNKSIYKVLAFDSDFKEVSIPMLTVIDTKDVVQGLKGPR